MRMDEKLHENNERRNYRSKDIVQDSKNQYNTNYLNEPRYYDGHGERRPYRPDIIKEDSRHHTKPVYQGNQRDHDELKSQNKGRQNVELKYLEEKPFKSEQKYLDDERIHYHGEPRSQDFFSAHMQHIGLPSTVSQEPDNLPFRVKFSKNASEQQNDFYSRSVFENDRKHNTPQQVEHFVEPKSPAPIAKSFTESLRSRLVIDTNNSMTSVNLSYNSWDIIPSNISTDSKTESDLHGPSSIKNESEKVHRKRSRVHDNNNHYAQHHATVNNSGKERIEAPKEVEPINEKNQGKFISSLNVCLNQLNSRELDNEQDKTLTRQRYDVNATWKRMDTEDLTLTKTDSYKYDGKLVTNSLSGERKAKRQQKRHNSSKSGTINSKDNTSKTSTINSQDYAMAASERLAELEKYLDDSLLL